MFATLVVFILYFLLTFGISAFSYRKSTSNNDYVIGGRQFSAGTVALSAGAADNSGWLLLALPGLAYSELPMAIWLVVSLLAGAYASWTFLSPCLRRYVAEAPHILTIPDLLEYVFRYDRVPVRTVAALIILIFSTVYAAANITAGAVLFREIFSLDYRQGIFLVIVFVMIITLIGGFTAICWMDIFQALLMFAALFVVPLFVYFNLNQDSLDVVQIVRNQFTALAVPEVSSGALLVSLLLTFSWGLGWGLGYFGQPHILTRFMVIKEFSGLGKAKRLVLVWMVFCLSGAILTGFFGALFFPQKLENPELVFLELARVLFPSVITGVLFASVWAAVMSTINAQLILAGSILANDICLPLAAKFKLRHGKLVAIESLFSRAMVVGVLCCAAYLAMNYRQTIMSFVAYAWAGFGASFGSLMIFICCGWRCGGTGAIAGMISGSATVIFWRALGYNAFVYELLAGFIVSFLVLGCFSLWNRARAK